MAGEIEKEALHYLESHYVLTLATTGEDGPWASAVFYVNSGFTLYFFSESHTRHGRNLAANPVVAAAIHEDYHDWREIKGIQLLGEATPAGTIEKARVIALFTRKFPSVSAFFTDPKYALTVTRAHVYRLIPREVWYLDNEKGFSSRQKLDLK